MVGRKDLPSIEKTQKVFIYISLFIGFMIAIPLMGFPKCILNILDMLPDNISALYSDLKIALGLVSIAITIEFLMFSTWGILIAGGDSRYATIVYQLCLWILMILPIVLLYYLEKLTYVPIIYVFMIIRLIATQFFIYRRYKSLKWYNKLV